MWGLLCTQRKKPSNRKIEKIFPKIDLEKAFYQVSIHPDVTPISQRHPYIYDICIASCSIDQNYSDHVFRRLNDNHLAVNLQKCEFIYLMLKVFVRCQKS